MGTLSLSVVLRVVLSVVPTPIPHPIPTQNTLKPLPCKGFAGLLWQRIYRFFEFGPMKNVAGRLSNYSLATPPGEWCPLLMPEAWGFKKTALAGSN